MKVAVIGIGVIGKVHLDILLDQGIVPVAICDVDPKKTAAYPDLKAYTDYREMLDKEQPNIVHICTPHYLHADMIIYALEHGINVLSEKPLCIHRKDIDRILEAEKNSTAQLGVCFQNRYAPERIFIKQYLKDKKIQSVYATMCWTRDAKYYNSAEWRGTWENEGGGALINQAIHTIDCVNDIVGGFEEISASYSNLSLQNVIEVEDTATLRFYGKAEALIQATVASPIGFPIEMVIQTEKELIRLSDSDVWINGVLQQLSANKVYYGKPCYGMGHAPLITDFYDCVKTGRKFSIDGSEGAKAVRIVLSAYESKGQRIKIY